MASIMATLSPSWKVGWGLLTIQACIFFQNLKTFPEHTPNFWKLFHEFFQIFIALYQTWIKLIYTAFSNFSKRIKGNVIMDCSLGVLFPTFDSLYLLILTVISNRHSIGNKYKHGRCGKKNKRRALNKCRPWKSLGVLLCWKKSDQTKCES